MFKLTINLNIKNAFQFSRYFCSSNKNIVVEKLTGTHVKIGVISMKKFATKNALGPSFPSELNDAVDEVRQDSSIWAVILRSQVPGVFCSGIDLKAAPQLGPEGFGDLINEIRNSLTKLESLPIPVIAAIDGHAIGGGMEVTLACDMRIASNNSKMGQVETKLGLFPGAGGSQRLPRLIGAGKAKQLIYLGSMITAESAENIGLVQYVEPQNKSGDAAYLKSLEIAGEIVSNAPIAIRMSKLAIDKGLQVDLPTGMNIEKACVAEIKKTKDPIEGMMAVLEKRKPIFKGE